jgi:hypothetical protein
MESDLRSYAVQAAPNVQNRIEACGTV